MKRMRARDYGIKIGIYPTGRFNSITDVKGVRVGHTTIIRGSGKLIPGKGPVRTGVTTILPNERVFDKKLIAGSYVLNGAGEMSGITQLSEWGLIETPIALTNTHDVGTVHKGIISWMSKKYERIWNSTQVVIPVVGECDDSYLNDSIGNHISEADVVAALNNAKGGVVEEGSVGSGTGMICCDFKGGIGTSSRVVEIGGIPYTLGALVMSNFGVMDELRIDGFAVGRMLDKRAGDVKRRRDNYGSIIVVIATDLPVSSSQIQRICKRSALGIGRMGSHAAHGSGEIIVGFSTGNALPQGRRSPLNDLKIIGDEYLGPAYRAVIEATEEAIVNSLCAAEAIVGINDNTALIIDKKFLKEFFEKVDSLELR